MPKLSDFLPDVVGKNASLTQGNQWLNKLYDMGFTGFLKAQYGSNITSAVQHYGIEQLYFDWLRQAYSYRRMFIQDLYLLAYDSSEIRAPLLQLKKEIFRKGFEDWHPKFEVKCEQCGIEFQSREDAKEHEDHGLRLPDVSQIEEFDKKWRHNCNIFGQDLESVLNELEDDVNIVDDLFLRKSKQYRRTADNRFLSQLVELRRIHPALVEFDLDKNGLPKNSHWLCPFHRDDVKSSPGRCDHPDCKEDLLPAMYIYNHRGNRIYLYEDELKHSSKFSPSTTYGYSPILTIMQKILTINGMDRFLYRYFFERKTPTQMILTNTDDPQSLEQERARMESRMMDDPTYTPWIAVSNRTGRGRTDVIKLFHTLHEMDYLRIREEIRDRVAGIYGVPQMFYNVMEGMGGISGQTQQLKMMSNVVSSDQRMFNEKLIPSILKDLGITDWLVKLRTPEEKVEGQVIQLAQQKVMIATQMRQMGFDVKLKSKAWDIDSLDFSFGGEAMSLQDQQQMGMMGLSGGMGGGDTPVDPSMFESEGEPQEEQLESEEEEFAPKKHRLEEEPYRQLTPDEEDEEEEDNVEEQTWS